MITVDQRHSFIQLAKSALLATRVQHAATMTAPGLRLDATVRAAIDQEDAERALFDFINSLTDWGSCTSTSWRSAPEREHMREVQQLQRT